MKNHNLFYDIRKNRDGGYTYEELIPNWNSALSLAEAETYAKERGGSSIYF